MAPKIASSSSPPISIGNCEVVVEPNKFTTASDPNSLQVSVSRKAKITISVKHNVNCGNYNDVCDVRAQEPEILGGASSEGCLSFLLVSPKDVDSRSKSLLQEVLNLYKNELPTMTLAANTGKQSMFLERCVFNGKYCSLLLKSKLVDGLGEVLSGITFQIIPADTQYAEIPLAAVSSTHQRKGYGHLLYKELRKRLQSVGVRTILCWGDEESEGFWFKQGFVSVAEVDAKGRARKLPVKAGIRKELCLPGGSTLMISHLNNNISANSTDTLKLCHSLKTLEKPSSSAVNNCQKIDKTYTPNAVNKLSPEIEFSAPPEMLVKGRSWTDLKTMTGSSYGHESIKNCQHIVPLQGSPFVDTNAIIEMISPTVDAGVNSSFHSAQAVKKRMPEALVSSLKSKRVKGSHPDEMKSDSNFECVLESSQRNESCFDQCSLATSVITYPKKNVEGSRFVAFMSKDQISEEHQMERDSFQIMLMNIADDAKKTYLTKIIEGLGGSITSDGSVTTHVITGKVRRTLNFCTALCSGAWILSSSWLRESFRKGRFVDEIPFILKDEDYELKYITELKYTVLRSHSNPHALLKGYSVCFAGHVRPPSKTLSAIVKAAGGTVINAFGTVQEGPKTIYVACEEDMDEALLAAKKGIWTFSSDWFMNCVMKQELDMEAPQFSGASLKITDLWGK